VQNTELKLSFMKGLPPYIDLQFISCNVYRTL